MFMCENFANYSADIAQKLGGTEGEAQNIGISKAVRSAEDA